MANRGRNSAKHNSYKKQRYLAQSFTFEWAFNDKLIKEIVSTTEQDAIMQYIRDSVPPEEPLCFFPDPNMDGMVLLSQVSVAYWENSLPPVPNLKNGVQPK